ncbi:SnoaL-like domain-containing protein [Arenibacter nanhaiticus]|uniref:SnoaL-like domain-containing protein n=1 Tax=Arenibacter nanhaiticus TaxID=558155 RepID=A0A1M6LDS9_9FLAO|nr:nuclear transport factor 2 family protein [Arenibacter nanhaiticus]SHJ69391.1 SnoaL-like domain-containing protein [Arenibacter nanhaiticus]
MKSKIIFTLIILFGVLNYSCKEKEQKVEEAPIDLVNDDFLDAQQAVEWTMDSIVQSLKDGDLDRLISFHAYGPKFTEFKNGEARNGGTENEEFERNVFSSVTEILKFDMNDMKIAVYDQVANMTFHSDFHLKFGEDLVVVNDQISLLFVNTKKGWRIVHEHHSPLKKEE